jgi:hypothetical protein
MPAGSSLNFFDLLLRVARRTRYARTDPATGLETLPDDPATLNRLKDAVNDARIEFYRRTPKASYRRQAVDVVLTADGAGPDNIAGNPRRVILPWFVSDPSLTSWQVSAGSGGNRSLRMTHPNLVLAAIANQPDAAGFPEMACALSYAETIEHDNHRSRWELRMFPAPDLVYTLTGMCGVDLGRMARLTDREPAGSMHEMAIVEGAVAFMMKADPDLAKRKAAMDNFDAAVAISLGVEDKRKPGTLGVAGPALGSFSSGSRGPLPVLDSYEGFNGTISLR